MVFEVRINGNNYITLFADYIKEEYSIIDEKNIIKFYVDGEVIAYTPYNKYERHCVGDDIYVIEIE